MNSRTIIQTPAAPQAIGPYSQAVSAGPLLFLSGQIPLDPSSGDLVGPDIATQTRQVLQHIRAILEAAGSSLERVVKTTVFLTDIGDFAVVNQVYGEFFPQAPPARSAVQVAALPRGASVEIEVIALSGTQQEAR